MPSTSVSMISPMKCNLWCISTPSASESRTFSTYLSKLSKHCLPLFVYSQNVFRHFVRWIGSYTLLEAKGPTRKAKCFRATFWQVIRRVGLSNICANAVVSWSIRLTNSSSLKIFPSCSFFCVPGPDFLENTKKKVFEIWFYLLADLILTNR